MPDAIEVRSLTRHFGSFVAVDAVTFSVEPGEIFGFLGPNGAGKTTTIKMLTGLLPPTSGYAMVAGHDVLRDPYDLRARIGYMSQMFSLYGDLTVIENIALFAGLYGVRGSRFADRRDWILGMADLEHRQDHLTASLPLGWKQRLALGCAVLHEPEILFLDEPTSGVDPMARRRFWDLIYDLASAGTTIMVSTHYMEEAEHCHRVALMNRGRLIALDRPATLRQAPHDPLFEVRTNDAPRAVAALESIDKVVDAALYGRNVHVTVTDASWAAEGLREVLTAARIGCDAVTAIDPSLEDVFVSLIRREGGTSVE
jgi:ABC-2 type transport system ATP-binding protein